MNHVEFSNNFDILFNNIMSDASPGLNEYEKSVLLTKAQDEIIKNYFNPKGNKYQEGFDGSAKRQIDFSGLISVTDCSAYNMIEPPEIGVLNSVGQPDLPAEPLNPEKPGFDVRGKLYKLPEDVFLIINESLITSTGVKQVVPISFDEYSRLMSKPYKEPLKYQAWRLVTESPEGEDIIVEVIPHSGETISKYTVRYVRRPQPIVLVDLASEYGDISINGVSTISECELNPSIHEEILQRAVELAKVLYIGDANSTIQIGQRSE